MRFTVSYLLDSQYLPMDYRRGFASLLKEALKKANDKLFERYYGRLHFLKPFTFSVYFPGLSGQEGERLNVGKKAILNFSTSSYELGTYVYNGLLSQRNFPLFDNTATLTYVDLKRPITIRQETAIFKALAPVLVNNKGNAEWYLLPGDEGFDEGLNFAVGELVRTFLGNDVDTSIEFKSIRIQRRVVRHYNMDMQGFTGLFELRARPDILNLVYQVGLGVRRSQGFGMLEVVRLGYSRSTFPLGGEKDHE